MSGCFNWLWQMLTGNITESNAQAMIQTIIVDVRLPRIFLTFIVGAALATSGNSLQAVFRNPLVCPYILGISSGAAFGAALAVAISFSFLSIQLSAFIFGLIAVILSYYFAGKKNNVSVVTLILSGMIVSGVFTALLTIVQFISDPFKLQTIVHWTMGNLHNANWSKLQTAIIPIMIGVVGLFIFRWRMNVLAMGDDEARAVGVNPAREKLLILGFATLATSASVAVAGIIGMYGLFIPHMVRMMIGPDNKKNMLPNILFGGSFLLLIDDLSRSFMHFEIPIGIFTMILGAPFFIFLMKRSKIGWE